MLEWRFPSDAGERHSVSAADEMKPNVFVASSVEGLELAYVLQDRLSKDANVIVWGQGIFGSGSSALANLSEIAANIDFAVFVFSPDDVVLLRQRKNEVVRQNLVLELGIFIGFLGALRTMIVLPEAGSVTLPTDLAGTNYLAYQSAGGGNDPSQALASVSNALRQMIKKLGTLVRASPSVPLSASEEEAGKKRKAVSRKANSRLIGSRLQPATAKSAPAAKVRLKGAKKSRPRTPGKGKAGKLFISYSHKDKMWLVRLQTMLKPLVRTGDVVVWDDTMIDPGSDWRKEIRSAIKSAKVAFLLVSPDFLASDFVASDELPRILSSAGKGHLKILWAAASKAFWEKTKIDKYQAAHDVSKPLDSYPPSKRNQVIYEVCVKIATALAE